MFAWLKSMFASIVDFFTDAPKENYLCIGNGILPRDSEIFGPAVIDPLYQALSDAQAAVDSVALTPVQQIHRLSEYAQNTNAYGNVACRFARQPIEQLFAGAKVDKVAGTGLEWTYRLDDLTLCTLRYVAASVYVTVIDKNQLN
jgi:hypothetical protein